MFIIIAMTVSDRDSLLEEWLLLNSLLLNLPLLANSKLVPYRKHILGNLLSSLGQIE